MSIEATFRSKCAACGEFIEKGDSIARDESCGHGEWVHEDCAEGDHRDVRFNLNEEARDG